ncbi:hypothetical protein TL16_g11213 [Triparma laevis f. inornata]|uniref:Uncharacterized protein n=1 Tax=Triparma laevis f. inornata TaxID=1714386 RepID=A0A9W7BDN7_9STRA|nr:hypothetical protein TL16_g11213 [Triparma laevis f. inornata]
MLKDQLHGKDAEIWRLQRELDLMKPQQVELEELRAKTLTFQKDIVDLNEALLEAQKITNDLNLLKEELRTIKQAAHTHEEDPISQDAQKKPLNAPEPPEPSNLEQLKGAPEDIKDMAHTHDADSNAGEPKIAPLAYPASPKEPPRLDQQLSHKHVSRSAAEEGSGPDALG